MNEPYTPTRRIVRSSLTFEYELFDAIEHHDQYKDLRDDLYNASENDTFILKINSGGGAVDVGMMVVKAILESRATVISRVMFPSASMAALIAISCDGMIMDKYSELMFHCYSAGEYGKSHELLGSVNSMHRHLVDIFNDVIGKFLTKSEIRDLWQGQDIRIAWDDDNLECRFKKHFTVFPRYE